MSNTYQKRKEFCNAVGGVPPFLTAADQTFKYFSDKLEALAKGRQEAHAKIMGLKAQSGYIVTVAIDNPEIERFVKAHITHLKRPIEEMRVALNGAHASLNTDDRFSLLDRINELEFEIEIIGIPELIGPQELSG